MEKKSYYIKSKKEWRQEAVRELLDQIEKDRINPRAYEEKYAETIEESLKEAHNGRIGKIAQLIGWDKKFLGDSFIVNHIIRTVTEVLKPFILFALCSPGMGWVSAAISKLL